MMRQFYLGAVLAFISVLLQWSGKENLLKVIVLITFVGVFFDLLRTEDLFARKYFMKFSPPLDTVMKKVLSFVGGYLITLIVLGSVFAVIAWLFDMKTEQLVNYIKEALI